MSDAGKDTRFFQIRSSKVAKRLAADMESTQRKLGLTDGVLASIRSQPWDRELSPSEVKRLSPSSKGLRTLSLICAKLHFLIDLVDDDALRGTIEAQRYSKRPAFRSWSDARYKLWSWSDPEVDRPDGRYPDLSKRYDDILAAVEAARKGKMFQLQAELEQAQNRIKALEKQNISLMDRLNKESRQW